MNTQASVTSRKIKAMSIQRNREREKERLFQLLILTQDLGQIFYFG